MLITKYCTQRQSINISNIAVAIGVACSVMRCAISPKLAGIEHVVQTFSFVSKFCEMVA